VFAALGLFAAVGLAACEPGEAPARDQWVVVVSTDAPVPQLGDRVLVEVLDDSGQLACEGCIRQFSAGDPAQWPVSFAVLPRANATTLRVRALLFRTDHVGADGRPIGDAHLDVVGELPAPSGITRVALDLSMACFGTPAEPEDGSSCDPATGRLATIAALPAATEPLAPGTWPPAKPQDCAGTPPDGMVCIPGGAFLLGDVAGFGDDELPERLVQVSAFALDQFEVTTREVERMYEDGEISRAPVSTSADPMDLQAFCNFDLDDTERDDLPINCMDYELAAEVCRAVNKRLPTEAEWEWAAGNGERETTFPWGDDERDVCGFTVIGRGRTSTEVNTNVFEYDSCRSVGGNEQLPWGPVAGPSEHDVTDLGIHHLAGNVSELVVDRFASFDDDCWSPDERLLVNPTCPAASGIGAGDEVVSLRGGSWSSLRLNARVYERLSQLATATLGSAGVRCAISLAPESSD
jgi:formylglycine-generating enzyme required for sulfatase activity